MYGVVLRFLDAMRNQQGKPCPVDGGANFVIDDSLRIDLLHAALLHDVGHIPFSHAGEAVFKDLSSLFSVGNLTVEEFLFETQEKLEKDLQFSEAVSLAILLSPRFSCYYSRCVRREAGEEDAILRVATLVAGMRPREDLRCASDLISSSAVDADKVDYINRDALACGIPVGIDVARLFLRSSFLTLDLSLVGKLYPDDKPYKKQTIFIVNASGVDTIDELALAKASLYQRVYLHQTTRNAERLFGKTMEALQQSSDAHGRKLCNAVTLIAEDDLGLIRKLSESSSSDVRLLANKLRNRELPKRACAIGRKPIENVFLPHAPLHIRNGRDLIRQSLGQVVERLRHGALFGKDLIDLEEEIASEATALRVLLRKAKPANMLPDRSSPEIVSVLPMKELASPPRSCIVLENNELIMSSDRLISEEQSDAAEIQKSFGFVVSDPQWREIVCLASRKVIERRFRGNVTSAELELESRETIRARCFGSALIDLPQVIRRASLRSDRLLELHSAAEDAGYYDDQPLLSAAGERDAQKIADTVTQFDGQGGWRVGLLVARGFLSQFPPVLRREFSERFSAEFTLLDRTKIASSLRTALEKLKPHVSTGVIIGMSPNSGNFVRWLAEQELRKELMQWGWRFEKTLVDALSTIKESETLIFCDDNIASGTQASCQFRAWMGIPRNKWPTGTQAEPGVESSALQPVLAEKLKNQSIAFAFCAGPKDPPASLLATLRDVGMAKVIGLEIGFLFSSPGLASSPELDEFLRKVGKSVLRDARATDTSLDPSERDKSCERDCAGYSGARAWIATPFSVPTATYPALWCPGIHDGRPWMPLLIRRGYLEKLIVF